MTTKKVEGRKRGIKGGIERAITSGKARSIVARLLAWFARDARDLPWRRTLDPYAIWVSEIMLQQTRVKTVLPYWERWMRALPDIPSLAAAKPETVLKLWEGLGYYTRARNLQQAAQLVMKNHRGRFPEDFEDLLALPGIGRYTAGAICSIAFNQPAPILDGNVIRVLTRLFAITENPRETRANENLWRLAERLVFAAARETSIQDRANVSGARPPACSHLNQSLMELGALICTPRQPKCGECPLRRICAAFRAGRVEDFPNLGRRVSTTARRFVAVVGQHRGRFLVRQRPADGLNARLWEFPNIELDAEAGDVSELARTRLGLSLVSVRPVCVITHSITRYRISLEAFHGRVAKSGGANGSVGRWFHPKQLEQLAFTGAHRKILKHLLAQPCSADSCGQNS